MSFEKKIVILAGPNGAGKTTFAREFLLREAECPIFVNADLIAGGLSPFTPNISSAEVVVRRFAAGWRNFERVYQPLVGSKVESASRGLHSNLAPGRPAPRIRGLGSGPGLHELPGDLGRRAVSASTS